MAKTNPLTNLWFHILWKTWGPSRIKKTYSFGLQVPGFGGAVWICNSTRSMSRDKIREAFSLQDKMGTWRGGHSLPNGKSST